jgi:hypothetical protein
MPTDVKKTYEVQREVNETQSDKIQSTPLSKNGVSPSKNYGQ